MKVIPRQTSLKEYRISILANGTEYLPVTGNYIRVISLKSVTSQKVKIKTSNGDEFNLGSNEAVKIQDFTRLEFSNTSATSLVVLVGNNADFISNSISSTVQVISGEIERVEAGLAFVRGYALTGANFAIAQLYNPAGSGYRILLNQVIYQCSSGASNVQFGYLPAKIAGATDVPVRNKLLGSADLPINFNFKDNATALNLEAGYVGLGGFISNNNVVPLPINEPILIPEGYGVAIGSPVAGARLDVSFQGFIG